MVNPGKALKVLPFYLIFFQDMKPAEAKVKELTSAAFPEGVSSFNEAVFYGDEVESYRIISLFQTPPFSGGRHSVLLRRAERLKKEEKESLFTYLKKPGPFAFLIMLFEIDRRACRQYSGIFPRNQLHFFLTGEEAEMADTFGIANALRSQNLKKALKILDRQYDGEKDFYRLFGILTWYLRSRVENYQKRITQKDALLFHRLYEIEKKFRQGKLGGRMGLELAIFALSG